MKAKQVRCRPEYRFLFRDQAHVVACSDSPSHGWGRNLTPLEEEEGKGRDWSQPLCPGAHPHRSFSFLLLSTGKE